MSRRMERAAAVDRAMATMDFRSIMTAALRDEVAKVRNVPVRFDRRVVAFPSVARGNALFLQSSQRTVSWVGIDYDSPPHLATETTDATAGLAAQLALLLDHGTSP